MANKDKVTTIRIWESTKGQLDELKESELESYNAVIIRMINVMNTFLNRGMIR